MNPIVILLSAFLLSVIALVVFIWSMRSGLLAHDATGAGVIFAGGETGHADDPAATPESRDALQQDIERQVGLPAPLNQEEFARRVASDRSSAAVARAFFISAVSWLIVGSFAGLIASVKLHSPDWLASYEWLTFGRIRVIHLSAVAYGWSALAGGGLGIWLLPRLLGTTLQGGRYAMMGLVVWNVALAIGLIGVAAGVTTGLEWLEFPWPVAFTLVVAAALITVPLMLTLKRRTVEHLYVSVWYLGLALFAFPVLYIVANLPNTHFGVQQAAMNWWYGHNVLGYFLTPLALASIYYFLPKVIGRPVYSYDLSLLAFWTLTFFYGQVGMHHLIGGPVPGWMVTLSISQGVMMSVPVAVFAVNQFGTMKGYWSTARHSPTLLFTVAGGLGYILSSFEGSAEGLRSINTVTHFTHFTVAHAHLGNYAFVTMVFFGGMYYAMPRIVGREWPYPSLITAHFWLVVAGVTLYVTALSIGGWLQGKAMLDAQRPFIDSVTVTLPWLKARTLAAVLMTSGHLLFAWNFFVMVYQRGPAEAVARLRPAKEEVSRA